MIKESKSKKIVLSDATLRDGSHAISHQLSSEDVLSYCRAIDSSGVSWVEIGHGNGLGASSQHIGRSRQSDYELLSAARASLSKAKLSVHVIPGIASIKRDLAPAIEIGVDVFRIGSHCSEADTTVRHIDYIRKNEKTAVGVLMMSHMLNSIELAQQALIMQEAGAEAIVIMDSAGAFTMNQVKVRIDELRNTLNIPLGIHAHNNLGLAVANSIVAVEAGVTIVDACAGGFGAGAGNAAIEILVPLLNGMDLCEIDETAYFGAVELALSSFMPNRPVTTPGSIATGKAGLFSGFLKPILVEAHRNQVDVYSLINELGRMKLVAGQEDVIIEVAKKLRGK